ncbi:MAG: SH3 domain-containing protein [Hungatella sp.]|jgi:cell wall-associated NlpC family hydrolase|nr:SH3 domain-containing protein [Hungatella sp.]MCI9635548.1 SH3 domain-containing protein [Hungatella sp.]
MFNKEDYTKILDRARKKRNNNVYIRYLLIGAVVALVIGLVILVSSLVKDRTSGDDGPGQEVARTVEEPATVEITVDEEALRQSEEARLEQERQEKEAADRQAVVDAYANLGMVQVSGYLNVRRSPDSRGDIIGKMQENSVCDILDQEGDWYHIRSGQVEGYISSQYVITGEEARALALEQVKLRAVVTGDTVNIRQTPEINPENIVAQALFDERYEVVDQQEGWVQTTSGYISSDFVEVKYALNEARKMDLKAMAINQYNNLLISKVTSYLNIRSSPKDEGNANIIGKLPGKAAAEILGTEEGWYKIHSGNITGYVSTDSQFTATGQEAIDLAMESASLMAIVNTDKLNVRTSPTTEATIWTQISKEERYPVMEQMDGWVQIELDGGDEDELSDGAYISTRDNNVEVRYALAEAIKFSPLEELANQQASRRNQIVNFALQYVGNPYVWGGTSLTRGADCSGFVQSVMRNFGINLPRTSREQAKVGRAINSSEMRPGDLIFYANSSGTINHVAMYIGNGQIVHAASRRSGIRISTWNYRSPARIRNVID